MIRQLSAYADVGTYGLAHSLLAWGRCRVWCNEHGIPMLAPSWLRLRGRLGPTLRRERDKRQYHLLFQFPGYVTGIRRALSLALDNRIPAERTDLQKLVSSGASGLVVFRNLLSFNEEVHFREIYGHGRQLRRDLLTITKPRYRPEIFASPHVALHIRMGDFSVPSTIESLRAGAKNSRIPVAWYAAVLSGIRERIGPLPARVVSDGTDAELADVLSMPDVERTPRQPSVSDLLSLAQANLVVSSGSGFSMWGAFLADAPRICFPGQRHVRVMAPDPSLDLEPECETVGDLEPTFWAALSERLRVA